MCPDPADYPQKRMCSHSRPFLLEDSKPLSNVPSSQAPYSPSLPDSSLLHNPLYPYALLPMRSHSSPPIPGAPGLHYHPRAATPRLLCALAPLPSQNVTDSTRLKVVPENLVPEEAAERHDAGRTAARSLPLTDLRPHTQDPWHAPGPVP